ncbi:hypothetical protein [Aquimarina brevivitae]|nr:hypothetical protein [Aquimarina brevivitae]
MKSIFILGLFAFLISCSSDDDGNVTQTPQSFEEITAEYISSLEAVMGDGVITATNDAGLVWTSGTIVLYKTDSGRFGKFKVLNIDPSDNYSMVIEAETYNEDGTRYTFDEFLEIRGTFFLDLDEMTIGENSLEPNDFWWFRPDATTTLLDPLNGAVFTEWNP